MNSDDIGLLPFLILRFRFLGFRFQLWFQIWFDSFGFCQVQSFRFWFEVSISVRILDTFLVRLRFCLFCCCFRFGSALTGTGSSFCSGSDSTSDVHFVPYLYSDLVSDSEIRFRFRFWSGSDTSSFSIDSRFPFRFRF